MSKTCDKLKGVERERIERECIEREKSGEADAAAAAAKVRQAPTGLTSARTPG